MFLLQSQLELMQFLLLPGMFLFQFCHGRLYFLPVVILIVTLLLLPLLQFRLVPCRHSVDGLLNGVVAFVAQ